MRIAPIIAILLLFYGIGVCAESQPPTPSFRIIIQEEHAGTKQTTQNRAKEQPGIESNSFVVKSIPNQESKDDADYKKYEHHEKPTLDRYMTWGTVSLAVFTFLLFCFTAALWWVTYRLSKDARITSERQAAEMAASISEAAKAASAMERVSTHMEISAKAASESVATLKERTAQQMRAYLTVTINNGIFQERTRNLKFDVRPTLSNSGNTPAHKITYWANADILPYPLPDDFQLPPAKNKIQSSYVLGPHQNVVLNAIVDDFVPDEDVKNIKLGKERRAYIWGEVSYIDAFGDSHRTKFSHSIYWLGEEEKEMIFGNYDSIYNEAD